MVRLRKKRTSSTSVDRRTRPRLRAGIFLAVTLLSLAVISVFTGFGRTPVDRYELDYSSWWPGGGYAGQHAPGSGPHLGRFFGERYRYPADLWVYQTGREPLRATSQEDVRASLDATVYFRLNRAALRRFHERVGYSRTAYQPAGWSRTVRVLLRPELEALVREQVQQVSVRALWSDRTVLDRVQKGVGAALPRQLTAALGGTYFCGPTHGPPGSCHPIRVVITRVGLPGPVQIAFEREGLRQVTDKRD